MTRLVPGGKIKIILSVFLGGVGSPHLAASPGYIVDMQNLPEILWLLIHIIHFIHMIVGHGKMIALVIYIRIGIEIVRRINVQFPVKHPCRGIGGIHVRYQWFFFHNYITPVYILRGPRKIEVFRGPLNCQLPESFIANCRNS